MYVFDVDLLYNAQGQLTRGRSVGVVYGDLVGGLPGETFLNALQRCDSEFANEDHKNGWCLAQFYVEDIDRAAPRYRNLLAMLESVEILSRESRADLARIRADLQRLPECQQKMRAHWKEVPPPERP